MTTVNTTALMLGMLAIGGLIAGGAMFTAGPAYAQPANIAGASNSDDDDVTQSNTAYTTQKAKVKCDASVSDDDSFQLGGNTNEAANDCDVTQTSTTSQANINQDNDFQIATADACQAIAGLIGSNFC
jgi:hypothetical protein